MESESEPKSEPNQNVKSSERKRLIFGHTTISSYVGKAG